MERFVIAVTRTCGSGATSVSKILADAYGIDMYDRKLLQLASEESGISEALFSKVDEHMKNSLLYRISRKVYNGELIPPESGNFTSDENLFNYQAKVLKGLAERESYICIGRACDYILQDYPNVLKVFLYAPLKTCVRKEAKRQGITEREAEKYIAKTDKYRRAYYKYHTGREWEDPYNYDLCLNTEGLTYEQCARVIEYQVYERFGVPMP
ncbi:MAG TPA: cytidylate kinase-like family protein [Candidatus Limivivens intestinipullorum]|uniref:Cytidylate kinase-like family protein n=1 Tax=Candidatus Limivivens intestinipullorum TaxID=2840858 RepID=A0A9D1EW22_9FIRM|nr:cytidylate kinase-like family protein [Candidatus Limivivens intestinipullorum]